MKTLIANLLFLNTCFTCIGQETEHSKYGFKLYTRFEINKEENSNYYFTSTLRKHQLRLVIPAFTIFSPKGSFHEISIPDFHFDRTIANYSQSYYQSWGNDMKLITLRLSLSYEYNFILMNRDNSKFLPFIGLSIDPSFNTNKFIPLSPGAFVEVRSVQQSIFSIIPRFNYVINEKWLVDFNFKGQLLSFSRSTQRNENPSLPLRFRKTSSLDLTYFPTNYLFRLGACYQF